MSWFLPRSFAINFVFDLAAWSVTIMLLRMLLSGIHALFVLFLAGAFTFFIFLLIYSVYLPVSIADSARYHGIVFSAQDYLQIGMANAFNLRDFFAIPYAPFSFGCGQGLPHTIFDISSIATGRIAALECLLPTLTFVSITVLGTLLYLFRPILRPTVSIILERLEEHPRVVPGIAILIGVVYGILKVVADLIG
ncbi:hypothetical protein [Actibacterium sp. D379-3]